MKYLLFLVCLFPGFAQLKAQHHLAQDTVEYARSKAYENKFKEADRLLTQYLSHKPDVNALRLHAQVLYWMKEFKRSAAVYEKAMAAFPDVAVVKLDYGRMLFELNKLNQAQVLLKEYAAHDSLNAEVNLLLAYIAQWNSRFKAARQHAQKVLKQYPDNQEARHILEEISYLTSPYLKGGLGYNSDDQPVNSTAYHVEAGCYRSWLLSPHLQIKLNNFTVADSLYRSLWLQTGNKINLARGSMVVSLAGGVFQHHAAEGQMLLTGSLGLSQKISPHFNLDLSTKRKPYQHSISSIMIPVMQQVSGIGIRFNKSDSWMGKVAYEIQQFADGNAIHTGYGWLLMPVINQKIFTLRSGYSFSYANSEMNTFRPVKVSDGVNYLFNSDNQVEGIYDPYFSPRNQMVHALLTSMKMLVSRNLEFSSRVSVGVFAKADNPFLYLGKGMGNELSIHKEYSEMSYLPVELQSDIRLNLSRRISISGEYVFNSLFFYKNQQARVHLNYRFFK